MILFPAFRAEAKIYIGIPSPGKQMLIAIEDFEGQEGAELSGIIREDLGFTGFFAFPDKDAFIEKPEQPFDRSNWAPLGVEAVVKGKIKATENKITAAIHIYDVNESRVILGKEYRADREFLRAMAHAIANDIYRELTGEEGVFRTKIGFVLKEGNMQRLCITDWDGRNIRKLGIKSSSLLSPHWSDDASKLIYSSERDRRWGIYRLDFDNMEEKLLYEDTGTSIAGDFFPGGEEFVFSSSKSGSPDIYIYNVPKQKLLRLTRDMGIEVSPSVSPDGNTIAFVSDSGGSPQVYTIDKIGYNKRRVTYDGAYNTSPSWSPKGGLILYSGRHEGKNQIFTVRADGTGLRMLTDKGNNEDPSFSPNGRFVTFTSDRDGKKGVYIMRSDGEAARRITPKDVEASAPRWSSK